MSTMEPMTTVLMAKIVFGADGLRPRRWPCRSFLKPERSAPTMVGSVLKSVMSPAAATAPAPMGRM